METKNNYQIRRSTWPQKTYISQRATVSFEKLPDFFAQHYGAIYNLVQKHGMEASDPPCAFYYSIDETKKETDMAAAVPVKEPVTAIENFQKTTLPASEVISTTHYGSYENMKPAYDAMEKYLGENGLQKELVIEEYFSDPAVDKDPEKWKTDIHFILKRNQVSS